MRYRKLLLPMMLSLFLLPLTTRTQTARGDVQPGPTNLRILLQDGSFVKGLVCFVMNLNTEYGEMTIPSGAIVSAKFNGADQWVDICMKNMEMRVWYIPASSDFKVTTSIGTFSINIAQIVSIESPDIQVAATAPPPPAPSPQSAGYQEQPPVAPYGGYAEVSAPPVPPMIPYADAVTWPICVTPQPSYCYPYGFSYVSYPGYGYMTIFRDNYGRIHRAPAGYGRASSPSSFRSSANSTFRSSASPTFRRAAQSFRSSAGATFRSGATTTFHSAAAPSFGSGGMLFPTPFRR